LLHRRTDRYNSSLVHRYSSELIEARERRDEFRKRDFNDSVKEEVLELLDRSIRRMEDSAESLAASLLTIQRSTEQLRKTS
jgi:hypothetical protein